MRILHVHKSKSKPEFDTEVPRLVLSFMVEGNYFINKLTVYSLTDEKWCLGADRPTQIIFWAKNSDILAQIISEWFTFLQIFTLLSIQVTFMKINPFNVCFMSFDEVL